MPHSLVFILSLALGMALATASFASGVIGIDEQVHHAVPLALVVLAGLLILRAAP